MLYTVALTSVSVWKRSKGRDSQADGSIVKCARAPTCPNSEKLRHRIDAQDDVGKPGLITQRKEVEPSTRKDLLLWVPGSSPGCGAGHSALSGDVRLLAPGASVQPSYSSALASSARVASPTASARARWRSRDEWVDQRVDHGGNPDHLEWITEETKRPCRMSRAEPGALDGRLAGKMQAHVYLCPEIESVQQFAKNVALERLLGTCGWTVHCVYGSSHASGSAAGAIWLLLALGYLVTGSSAAVVTSQTRPSSLTLLLSVNCAVPGLSKSGLSPSYPRALLPQAGRRDSTPGSALLPDVPALLQQGQHVLLGRAAPSGRSRSLARRLN